MPGIKGTKFTESVVEKFLTVLKEGRTVGEACKFAGISNRTYYRWLSRPDFASDVVKARVEGKDRKRQKKNPAIRALYKQSAREGRNLLKIDLEQLDKLAVIGCTPEEIASYFDTTIEQLDALLGEKFNKTLASYVREKAKLGNIKLRRAQFREAMNGNTQMLTWLGKNILGQVDRTTEGATIKMVNILARTRDEILALEGNARARVMKQIQERIRQTNKMKRAR